MSEESNAQQRAYLAQIRLSEIILLKRREISALICILNTQIFSFLSHTHLTYSATVYHTPLNLPLLDHFVFKL